MKLVSSFMDELVLDEGKCHAITFKCSRIQMKFKQSLNNYFRNRKKSECTYVKILKRNGSMIDGRDFHFIPLDSQAINLSGERSTNKIIQDVLYHYLENDPNLIKEFIVFNEQLETFISSVEIISDKLTIDFQPSDKTINQIIKSLDIFVQYKDSDYVPNYLMRNFLIKAIIEMNVLNKSIFILISYPETDVGLKDFAKVVRMLKELQVTILIITSNYNFLSAVKEENMFLINDNGALYDIMKLRQELIAFDLVNQEQAIDVTKKLAFLDFTEDYLLLDTKMKEFLLSNRL